MGLSSVTSVAAILAAIITTAIAADQIQGIYKQTSPANAPDVLAFLDAIEAPAATKDKVTSQKHDMEWIPQSDNKYTLKFHPKKGGNPIVFEFEIGKESDTNWITGSEKVKFLGTKPAENKILVTVTHPKYVITVDHSFSSDGAINTITLVGKGLSVKQTFARK